MMAAPLPTILIFGASGLIGEAMARHLMREGFPVVPVARRFTAPQKAAFGERGVELPVLGLEHEQLVALFADRRTDIVVNCVGVLQDSTGSGSVEDAHGGFAGRLVAAVAAMGRPAFLVHVSIPGRSEEDRTAFSRSKREAERIISGSTIPFIMLRPGFVIAASAYGGSALMRAFAALPVQLPQALAARPFASTDAVDIARTIAAVAQRWQAGEHRWRVTWDVMERDPSTVGEVIAAFRHHFGGPVPRLRLPSWLMALGAIAGDVVVHLGWSPPIRSTALAEMQRGVAGDPGPWIAATGIEPSSLEQTLTRIPPTVQEQWFACLYLLKPFVIGLLAIFWIVSGLIPLTLAFDHASAILTGGGLPAQLAQLVTVITSLADILIGAAIAFRRTCRVGLLAGIALSILYLLAATIVTPMLWIEPLGALVKIAPVIALMLVALAISGNR